jgi:hypothetical protein
MISLSFFTEIKDPSNGNVLVHPRITSAQRALKHDVLEYSSRINTLLGRCVSEPGMVAESCTASSILYLLSTPTP